MLNELETAAKVVGVKQVRRALTNGQAKRLYLAKDADPHLTGPLERQAGERNVEVAWTESLGKACGIAVGAAVAAII